MAGITKRSPKVRLQFVAARRESIHGGLPAIEALAQQFGLWEKLCRISSLDPRTRKSRGYSPELLVAQLIYSLCSGGASLADAERLNEEPLAKRLARVPGFADQTTLGQWLRAQTPGSVAALWALVREFVTLTSTVRLGAAGGRKAVCVRARVWWAGLAFIFDPGWRMRAGCGHDASDASRRLGGRPDGGCFRQTGGAARSFGDGRGAPPDRHLGPD